MKRLLGALLVLMWAGTVCAARADTLDYTRVYEPDTSWPLAATVGWLADGEALEAARQGPEKALQTLLAALDQWNATYNPSLGFSEAVVRAGRHRGLTVWPWIYNDPADFAQAYLQGIYGITTDWAWWASDYVVSLQAGPEPVGLTRSGRTVSLPEAELLPVTEGAAIWRYRAELTVDGQDLGAYYLYSNPFSLTAE